VYNLSGRDAEGATMGCLYRLACGSKVGLLGLSIYRFEFADSLSLQLGLSVKALDGDTTKSGTCNH
jgi:hypothetical protein